MIDLLKSAATNKEVFVGFVQSIKEKLERLFGCDVMW